MPLRFNAINYLQNVSNLAETDFYQFGINQGLSFRNINSYITQTGHKPNKIWGFDSFVGLPKEKEGLPIINGWEEGYFNVKQDMGLNSVDEVIKTIMLDYRLDIPCEMISGFFCDSLTKKLVTTKGMKKASFIDIDVDLYQSTIEVFDWLIGNDLLNDLVVVNFDDWGGVEEYSGGESKAFKDIIEKYNLNVEEIFTTNRVKDSGGIWHIQKVFTIKK